MLLFYDYVTLFQDPKLNGAAVGPNSYAVTYLSIPTNNTGTPGPLRSLPIMAKYVTTD